MTYPARLASGLPLAALGTDNALFAAIREAFPTIRVRLHNGEEYQITLAGKTYADDCAAYVSKPYGRGNTTELQEARQEVWNAAKIMADWQATEAGPEETAPVVALPTEQEARAQVLAMAGALIDGQTITAAHLIQYKERADEDEIFWIVQASRAQHEAIAETLALIEMEFDRIGKRWTLDSWTIRAIGAAHLRNMDSLLLTASPEAHGEEWCAIAYSCAIETEDE